MPLFRSPPPSADDPTEPSAAAVAKLPFPLRPPPPGPLPPARYEELAMKLKYGDPIPPDFELPWKSDPTDPEPMRFDLVDRDSVTFRNYFFCDPPLRRPAPEYEEVPLPLGGGKFVVWSKQRSTKTMAGRPGLPPLSRPYILHPDPPPGHDQPTTTTTTTHPRLLTRIPPKNKLIKIKGWTMTLLPSGEYQEIREIPLKKRAE